MSEVLGKPRSVQVLPSFGAVSDLIPIVVSPGRRNVQPQLALTFNSMGGLGDAGVGWQIDTGVVSRWRGDGTPTVGYQGAYSFSIAGAGGELRPAEGGVYRAMVENMYREFKFVQGQDGQGYWVMDNGEGARHYFGSTAGSRIPGELWMLDRVEDAFGNTITYKYLKHAGALYIQKILYTGYAPDGDLGANRVEFNYEDRRARNVRISYGNSAREERRKRLKSISVFTVGSKLVRRYELSYREDSLNGQSFLSKVTLVGSDGTSRIVLRNLAYGSRSLSTPGQVTNTLPLDLAVYDSDFKGARETGARIIDVNGDGFADAVENQSRAGLHHIYLGDGKGNFSESNGWSTSLTKANIRFIVPDGDHKGTDDGVRLMDVNADGLPDLFIAKPNRREVWINTGKGWKLDADWTAGIPQKETVTSDSYFSQSGCLRLHCDDPVYLGNPSCIPHCTGKDTDPPGCLPPHCKGTAGDPTNCLTEPHCASSPVLHDEPFALVDEGGDSKGVQLADVNGDGRVDIVWSMTRTDQLFYIIGTRMPLKIRAVYLNTGKGWQWNQNLTNALVAFGDKQSGPGIEFVTDSEINGYDMLDANGDGLADIVGTFAGAQAVYLGTGGGWARDADYSASLVANGIISLNGDRQGQGLIPVDFDDDGLVDYLRANETVTKAYHNTGTGWAESPSMTPVLSSLGIAFNSSDGKSNGTVLADIDGDGITDFVKAEDGTRWVTLSKSLRTGLLTGANSAVGEQTTLTWKISTAFNNLRQDGVQGLPVPRPVPTKIIRRDGRGQVYTTSYNYGGGLFENRQFLGFAWTEEILPTGLHVKKWDYQDTELVGRMAKEEWHDGARVWKRASSNYETVDAPRSSGKQVLLRQTDEEMIDPGGSIKTRLRYDYDDKLNITAVFRDPDVDQPGDESTTYFTWAGNSQAGIWSLPARTTAVEGHDGPVLSEFIMYYDNLPEGQAQRGMATRKKSLVQPGAPGRKATHVQKSMEYDKYGNLVALTDERGKTALFVYGDPASSFRTQAVDPLGRTVHSEYDAGFGGLLSDTDASGNETLREYDVFGRLRKVTLPGDDPSIGTRKYEYSDLGNANAQWFKTKETETPGQAGTFDTAKYFDGLGRVYRVEQEGPSAAQVVLWTRFDDADNPVATSRPHFEGTPASVTEIIRDKYHRPVSVKEPDGTQLKMEYAGPRVDVVDRRGHKTSFYRNAEGKTTEVRQRVGGKELVTRYQYDPLGRLTAIVDALGSETLIAYDALDRRIRLDDPNTGTYTYRYDGKGLLIEQTAPGGHPTFFTYNDAGDLIRKQFPDGKSQEYTYGLQGQGNGVGRVTRIEDAAGSVQIAYDVRGKVSERRRTVLGRTYVTGYAYDSMGRIRRVTYPDGFIVNYGYDSGGNLMQVTDGDGRAIATYENHNAAGQLGGSNFGNGIFSSFSYDKLLRMTSIQTVTGSGDRIQELDYSYDAGSNIRSIEDKAFGNSQEFVYDEIDRLTKATGPYGEELYRYDAIGNLLRKGSLVFEVDPAHLQRVVSAVDPTNRKSSFQLDYDERGNVVQKGDSRYEYDSENQLVRVRDDKGKLLVENTYDAGGQRLIEKTRNDTTLLIDGIYEENKTHVSRHVRAGSMLVATIMTPRTAVRLIDSTPPPIYTFDGKGAGINRIAMTGRWHWVLAALASFVLFSFLLSPAHLRVRRRIFAGIAENIGEARRHPGRAAFVFLFVPLFVFTTSQTTSGTVVVSKNSGSQSVPSEKRYYYHSSHLGNVSVVTDDRGKVVERREYKPYGDRFDWTGPNSGPRELSLTFNGQQYDDATGLYYMGARHYDPEIGRFLTADTKVPDPMNPKSLNRYAFAGGNPVRYSDPTGHAWYDWLLAIVIVVAIIVIGVVTFGVGLAIGGTVAGILGFTGLMAALGAAAMGIYAMTRMPGGAGGDFNWKSFGMALAAGAVIGAAVGASLALLPYSLGFTWSLTAASFWGGLAADVFIGAVLGGLGPIVSHLANGGGPEEILTSAIGYDVLTGAIKGAIYGLLLGGILGKTAEFGQAAAWFAGVYSAVVTLEGVGENVSQGFWPGNQFSLLNIFGTDSNWFRNSPAQDLGIPSWAFEGTWLGFGDSPRKSMYGPILQTMPLAP